MATTPPLTPEQQAAADRAAADKAAADAARTPAQVASDQKADTTKAKAAADAAEKANAALLERAKGAKTAEEAAEIMLMDAPVDQRVEFCHGGLCYVAHHDASGAIVSEATMTEKQANAVKNARDPKSAAEAAVGDSDEVDKRVAFKHGKQTFVAWRNADGDVVYENRGLGVGIAV